jgi:hypothetical protein
MMMILVASDAEREKQCKKTDPEQKNTKLVMIED